MSTPSNPPAFPTTVEEFDTEGDPYQQPYPGMTLRDLFAGRAMQGSISNGALQRIAREVMSETTPSEFDAKKISKITANLLASMVYEIADAMLAEREKGAAK